MLVLIVLLLLLVSAFFSVAEIALTAARRTRLQQLYEHGDRRALQVMRLKEEPGNFFTVVQIGVNTVAILAGVLGEKHLSDWVLSLVVPHLDSARATQAANLTSFIVITVLFIQFADLIPKRLAMIAPERCALAIAGPMMALMRLFRPLVWLFTQGTDFILRIFNLPTRNVEHITPEDIAAMVGAGAEAGTLHSHEIRLIENVFELESKSITSVMTVRDEVAYFTVNEPVDLIKRKLIDQPYSQYLVCREDIDSVIGFIQSKDILQRIISEESMDVIRTLGKYYDKNLLTLPDTLNLSEALTRFKEMHQSFAAVVNEYGLVVGVVTLDDIVSALMGDIIYSSEDEQIVQRDEYSWLIDGLTPIDDVKKALDIGDLPGQDHAETIAGLVIYTLKRIPKKSEFIETAGYRFEVVDIDSHKIDQLLVSRLGAGLATKDATPARPSQ
ncbi:HlyC/CorC family transporter [Imbroritus primus]|uniref:HlyC/CorC family transporter n=1 Tax=Imbroritus primus TaxID=3058603 RepID=A0ACD3SKT8_9BURK|nr:HlyC/CorC family transporter [Burkholderiaceae bacterium PBA]